jgi:hypothetical protein
VSEPAGKRAKKPPATAAAVSIPAPPPDLGSRKLEIRTLAPQQLFRVARDDPKIPLLNFRATKAHRFDAPDRSFGTLYVADSLAVCFAETLLRGDVKSQPLESGRTFIPESEIATRVVVALDGAPLRLAIFKGAALKRLGGDARLSSMVPYDVPQQWSKALHDHPLGIDGFIYMSRHVNDREAVVLFERTRKRLTGSVQTRLLEHPDLGHVLDLFEVGM